MRILFFLLMALHLFLSSEIATARARETAVKKCRKDDVFTIDACGTTTSNGISFQYEYGYLQMGHGRYGHVIRLWWDLPKPKGSNSKSATVARTNSCCTFQEEGIISDSPLADITLKGNLLKLTSEYDDASETNDDDGADFKLKKASTCWRLSSDRRTFEELDSCPSPKK